MPLDISPSRKNLRRLFALRNIAIAGQCLAIAAVRYGLELRLPLAPMVLTVALLTLLNLATWLRLQRAWPVTDAELFVQLVFDVIALTALLYYSGGSTNPFVSLYLLPLIIAATALAWGYTWAMAAVTVACYSALMFYNVPLPHDHSAHGEEFNLHVVGMWLTFVLSAALIVWFVVRMNATIRERDRLLEQSRIEALRTEQIVALGTLAAGAAHELGTPLATMAVVTKELQRDYAGQAELQANLAVLRDQVESCKRILTGLLASTGQERSEGAGGQALDRYLHDLLDKWQLMRPTVKFKYSASGSQPAPVIVSEQTLSQAILNLLNNAADASPEQVEIAGRWDQRELQLEICDRGAGLSEEAMARAGQAFFTTKAPGQGLGIGLFLANASVERCGGRVRLFNREGGGACIQVTLPLAALLTAKA